MVLSLVLLNSRTNAQYQQGRYIIFQVVSDTCTYILLDTTSLESKFAIMIKDSLDNIPRSGGGGSIDSNYYVGSAAGGRTGTQRILGNFTLGPGTGTDAVLSGYVGAGSGRFIIHPFAANTTPEQFGWIMDMDTIPAMMDFNMYGYSLEPRRAFRFMDGSPARTEWMRIEPFGGRIGVHNIAPDSQLTVGSATATHGMHVHGGAWLHGAVGIGQAVNEANTRLRIVTGSVDGDYPPMRIENTNAAGIAGISLSVPSSVAYWNLAVKGSNASFSIRDIVGGDRLTILSSGRVGLSNLAPDSVMTVGSHTSKGGALIYGGARIIGNVGAGGLFLKRSSPYLGISLGLNVPDLGAPQAYTAASHEGGVLFAYTNTADNYKRYFDISSTGAIGAPYGGSAIRMLTNPDNSETAVERLRIDKTGYVGIGTTIPKYLLHIAGPVYSSGCYRSDSSTVGKDATTLARKDYVDAQIATVPNYDTYVFSADGVSPNASNAEDSSQLLTDGTNWTYCHAPGLQFYIDRVTLLSGSATFYGATYANGTTAWGISADSSISINIRKSGSNYYLRYYKHALAVGTNTPRTGGTLLYSELLSSSFFPVSGTVSLKATVWIRRKHI